MTADWKKTWFPLILIIGVFLIFYFLPSDIPWVTGSIYEALALTSWYAKEHVLLCLVPAFFIAGGIAVFISQGAVMKYLGVKANKFLAYSVASVSGSILAVCSCTVLPLFAGIYRMGAGIGPATAFLYSGPAINVLAIILTARVLGFELGVARAVGAVLFSVLVGLLMHLFFRKEEREKSAQAMVMPEEAVNRPLWQNGLYFAVMVAILVFANWGASEETGGVWSFIYNQKWLITSVAGILLGLILIFWMHVRWWKLSLTALITLLASVIVPELPAVPFTIAVLGLILSIGTDGKEPKEWLNQTWGFAKQIMPLLFYGVLIAGFLLGRPGHEGLLPSEWIASSVGGNSLGANLFASVAGAFMYFATLTEIPILQGLIGNGMGKGPALALLLAGPALSLPNMLVIRSVIGTKKTMVFVGLVIIMSTIIGIVYGYVG